MKNHIIIMAKDPFQSNVKTRLASTIGEEAARGIYARLLYDTLNKVLEHRSRDYRIILSLSMKKGEKYFKEAYPELFIETQCPGNIGIRMQHAFDGAFDTGAEKAVLIGTDVPGIEKSILKQAFTKVNDKSIVIGPTGDGGYYLIGMARPGINIFNHVSWSSPEVFRQTIRNIEEQGYKAVLLPELEDIDNEADLRNWQSRIIINNHDNSTTQHNNNS